MLIPKDTPNKYKQKLIFVTKELKSIINIEINKCLDFNNSLNYKIYYIFIILIFYKNKN